MPSIGSEDFPEDLVRVVFENVLGDDYAFAVYPLLLVCKRWKELAFPFLYRSLSFASPSRLQKASVALHLIKETTSLDVGTLVRRLEIQDGVNLSRPDAMNALFSILISTNCLEHVRLPTSAYSGILQLLVHNCAHQLYSLDLSPRTSIQAGLAHLAYLQHLTMLVIKSDSINPPDRGWALPRLRQLVWWTFAPSFLAKCRFSNLVDAEICLQPVDSSSIAYLRMFLTGHPGIRVLKVQYWDPDLAERISSAILCEHLHVTRTVPPADSIAFIPPPVRTLTIPSRVSGETPWHIFDALLAGAELGPGLEEIRVQGDDDGSFLWTHGPRSAQHAQFIGHLLGYAPRLRARGIRLVDDYGECPYLSVT